MRKISLTLALRGTPLALTKMLKAVHSIALRQEDAIEVRCGNLLTRRARLARARGNSPKAGPPR
jgi:hypothetical protein